MPARQRLTFAAIAAVIAVLAVVLLAASGGSDGSGGSGGSTNASTEAEREATPEGTPVPEEAEPVPTETPAPRPKPRTPRIVVRGAEPVGGVRELEYDQGDRVRFTVTSDVADHVHVHGYDLMEDVGPGQNATFSFKASITGIFEAELEDRGVQVVSLRVNP